jgi:hypothetical protein
LGSTFPQPKEVTAKQAKTAKNPLARSILKVLSFIASNEFRGAAISVIGMCSPLKLRRQIFPVPIHIPDKIDLLLPRPRLDLLFPGDGGRHIFENLVINQSVSFVPLRESIDQFHFVLGNAFYEVVRHARVKGGTVGVCRDVNKKRLTQPKN